MVAEGLFALPRMCVNITVGYWCVGPLLAVYVWAGTPKKKPTEKY